MRAAVETSVLAHPVVGIGPADVGAAWLALLPYAQTFTAERAAYRNLVCGLVPPLTATVDNPYREWIGAQIRGDLWGYVCSGDPRAAARLAFADASLSHTANGIYGEMWVAALVAVAATTTDMAATLRASLEHVPPGEEDVEYLLAACNEFFGRSLGTSDITGAYAGVRPLVSTADP